MPDINNIDEFRHALGGDLKGKQIAMSKQQAKQAINDLQSMIYNNLTSAHIIRADSDLFDMFGSVGFNNNTNSFVVSFNDNAYAYSKLYGPRESRRFLPTLLNYGYKNASYDTPHFQGYKGSLFISDAIEQFNAKYKKLGLVATFEVNGLNMDDLYPSGAARPIPYLE